jgi:hypothetical protein
MESIIDTMLERHITVYTDDPHSMIFDILKGLSTLGEYDEKKNVYETDGPTKRVHVVFSIVDKLDKSTKIDIAFDLIGRMGKSSYLEILVEGNLITKIDEPKNIFSETFLSYYLSNISQEYKKIAKQKMREVDEVLVNVTKNSKRVYL